MFGDQPVVVDANGRTTDKTLISAGTNSGNDIISTSDGIARGKSQLPISTCKNLPSGGPAYFTTTLCFGQNEAYYLSFKEKRSLL
ncbi:hypothetical protein HAX54_017671 [Datura stramonium]|uniref:Uncharacterized protein n=1 Tax=Datura stramonium TaxID=4076 RepID=A0ABS8UMR9_DATST|nr:hypothetical protein [Datura stramonium]